MIADYDAEVFSPSFAGDCKFTVLCLAKIQRGHYQIVKDQI